MELGGDGEVLAGGAGGVGVERNTAQTLVFSEIITK